MSERNGNVQNGKETNGTGISQVKQTMWERAKRRYHVFKATKGGRWTIRGAKAVSILGLLGFTADKAYKAGKKSVVPTIVYVQPDAEEAPPMDEQETAEESAEPEPAEEAE